MVFEMIILGALALVVVVGFIASVSGNGEPSPDATQAAPDPHTSPFDNAGDDSNGLLEVNAYSGDLTLGGGYDLNGDFGLGD